MFLVASRVAWRRATVQFISRAKYGGILGCDENLCARPRRTSSSKQRKLIQVRLFNDEKFRMERKVNYCTRTRSIIT